MVKLNLGSWTSALAGHVNVDRVPVPGVDVVHDLDMGPWPFEDGSVEGINAEHVFEHVGDPILFMTECWRILKPWGQMYVITPYYRSPDAFTDPTHRRFCTEYSFNYWIPGNIYHEKHNQAYGGISFEKLSLRLAGGALHVALMKLPLDGSLDVEVAP